MPLYQLMKKIDHFVLAQRANDAFNDLKRALSTAPVQVALASREPCCCTLQPLDESSVS
jgi:hypothetical protein